VRTWAEQLGYGEHVQLLQQTLDEEKMADELLTRLATSALNIEAEEGDDGDEESAAADTRRSRTTSKKTTRRSSRQKA
jgi:hypothetical protein